DKEDIEFRLTKDIDIVVLLEVLNKDFNDRFQLFVSDAGYKHIKKSTGEKQFYRFENPDDGRFPVMIELFSKKADLIDIKEDQICAPITVDEEINSLSAILLNEEYYDMIKNNCVSENNITFVQKEIIIPLKARAYIDNISKKEKGIFVGDKDIRKHRGDIFRIADTIAPDTRISIPSLVQKDLADCLNMLRDDDVKMKDLGITTDKTTLIENVIKIYSIS
ncbi:MAG: hypothetical protein LRY50_11035, partial [Geovibrio sp.]|nr:hypothetical protein [Geovibrio sp.]